MQKKEVKVILHRGDKTYQYWVCENRNYLITIPY